MSSPQKHSDGQTISTKLRARPAPAERPPVQSEAFRQLDADLYLANQIFRRKRVLITAGETSYAYRKERIRRALLAEELDETPVLDQHGNDKAETLGAAFLRLYGEPLL